MTRISLTPIIDVVFILLIFFMLATNFQSFNKTDIKISNESANVSQSDKKIYLIEFNIEKQYKLNGQVLSIDSIKSEIIKGKNNQEELIVVIKPEKNTNVQSLLSLIENLKSSNIKEITLGISKEEKTDKYIDRKKSDKKMPLLEKL